MASKTLPALIAEANEIASILIDADGETSPELEAALHLNGVELKAKVDTYCAVIDSLKARREYCLARMLEWEKATTAVDRSLENLKGRVKHAIHSLNMTEVHGFEYAIKLMPNPPSVIVDDQEKIPGEFITTEVKTITKVDKKSILDAIKDGRMVEGVHIERGSRLSIKVSGRKELKESEKS